MSEEYVIRFVYFILASFICMFAFAMVFTDKYGPALIG